MKEAALLLILLLVFVFSKPAFAEFSLNVYSPQATDPTFAEVFAYPFHPKDLPLFTIEGIYDAHIDKIVFTFPTRDIQTTDIYLYQPMQNNDTLTTTAFVTQSGSPITHTVILHAPIQDNISFHIEKQNTDIVMHIESTNNEIDFTKYPQAYLFAELKNNTQDISSPITLDTSCPQYFCGSISATFPNVLSGNYDIAVNFGKSSLIYIKNALTLLASPQTPNSTIPSKAVSYIPQATIAQIPQVTAAIKPTDKTHILGITTKQIRSSLKRHTYKKSHPSFFTYILSFFTKLYQHVIHSI